MNSINIINDSYQNTGESSNGENDVPHRRASASIKDRVSIFEKQIEELEQKRNSRNLFELTKKFGLQKYLNKDNSQTSQSNTPKNFQMIDFMKEVDDMCQNYEKEIEFHKRKNSAFKRKQTQENGDLDRHSSTLDNIYSCNNCRKSLKEIEEMKANLSLKDEEIKKLSEENDQMQKRFNDLNIHLNSMMVCLQRPDLNDNRLIQQEDFSSNSDLECIKENYNVNYLTVSNNTPPLSNKYIDSNQNIKICNNHDAKLEFRQVENKLESRVILIELISENILNEYISLNSLNINSLNEILLNEGNLLKFTNTIFVELPNSNMILSIYHEYIEAIFIHIYLSFLKCKSQKNTNLNNKQEFSWMISEEEVDDEVVMMTVEDIYSLFYNLNNNKYNKIQDIKLFYETTFEKKMYSRDKNILSLKSEILSDFNDKVRIYEDRIKEDLTKIVRVCKSYIHAGKIVYRNRIIYDYAKLYSEIKICDDYANKNSFTVNRIIRPNSFTSNYKCENKLIFIQPIEVTHTIDNLLNFIKYYSEEIESIVLKRENNTKHRIKSGVATKNNVPELNLSSRGEKITNIPFTIIFINILSKNNLVKQIKSLTINNIKLDEKDLSYLNIIIELATNLITLDLNGNSVEDSGLRSLSEYIKLNQSISSLYLCNNKVTHNGAFYLSDMLLKNNSVSYLYLGKNNLSGMGLQSLVSIIINGNKSIKFLDLSDNRLTGNDIIIISNLIIKNCSYFEGLDLSNNRLESDSIHTIGLALRANVYMKSIYLNDVGLNEDSTPYFFQHLIDANLQDVNLDNNILGEVGGVLFANLLKSNNSLRNISLRNTMLNSVSLICISHALELQYSKGMMRLQGIELEDNNFDDYSIETLMKICENFIKKQVSESSLSSMPINSNFPKISFSKNDCLSEVSKEKIRIKNFECLFLN